MRVLILKKSLFLELIKQELKHQKECLDLHHMSVQWILIIMIQIIIWRRLVADSSDFCKNLSTTWKERNLAGKKSKRDYYKRNLLIEQCKSMSERTKIIKQKNCGRNGKGQGEQCTYLVYSFDEMTSSNLATTNLNTKLNLNEKSCAKISFCNKLRE